eukprot:8028711-Ditylum_brightwellii.AAC.1
MKKENENKKGQERGEKKTWNANKHDQQGNQPYIKPTKFKGRCEGLKGHVTLKEIVTYITKEYHHGQGISMVLEKIAAYQIPIPTVSTQIMDLDLQDKLKKQMESKFLKKDMAYEENLGK